MNEWNEAELCAKTRTLRGFAGNDAAILRAPSLLRCFSPNVRNEPNLGERQSDECRMQNMRNEANCRNGRSYQVSARASSLRL